MTPPGLNRYSHILIALLGAWLTGTAVALHTPQIPSIWAFLFAGVGFAGLTIESERRWVSRGAIILLAGLLAVIITHARLHTNIPTDISHWAPQSHAQIEGIISHRQVKDHETAYRLIIKVLGINGQHASGHLMVWKITPNPQQGIPPIGSHIALKGNLRTPQQPGFSQGFNEAVYLRSKSVSAVLTRPQLTQVLTTQPQSYWGYFQQQIQHLQTLIQQTFQRHLSKKHAQLLGGVVLGDRAIPMDADARDSFIQTGLIHFLAASGFNVGVVAGAILLLLRRWKTHERWKLLITGFFVLLYMALAGLSPSVMRAGTMVLIAFGFRATNQNLSPLLLLMLAATSLALWNPAILDDIGFQLSALTTLGIITMVPPIQHWAEQRINPWLSGLITVPLIAQLWVVPISITVFNQLPLHSVLLNLVAALCVTPLTLIGFTAAAIAPLWSGLAAWVCVLAKPFAWALLWIVQLGARFDQWVLHPTSPPVWVMWGSYACLMMIAWVIHQPTPLGWNKRRKFAAAALLPAIVFGTWGAQVWASRQHAQVTLFHPSEYTWALDMQPAQSNQHVLILEKPVGYWEQRNITEYARHHIGDNLTSVVYLNGNSEKRSAIKDDSTTTRLFLGQATLPATAGPLAINRDDSRPPIVDGDVTYRIANTQATETHNPTPCLLLITDDTRRTFECAWTLYHYPNRPVELFQYNTSVK